MPSTKHLCLQNNFWCKGVPFLLPMSQCGELLESPWGGNQAVLAGCCCRFVPGFITSSLRLENLQNERSHLATRRDGVLGEPRRGSTAIVPPSLSDTNTRPHLAESQKTEFSAWFQIGGWGALSELFKGLITESQWFVFFSVSLLRIPLPPSSLTSRTSQYPCSSILKGAFVT